MLCYVNIIFFFIQIKRQRNALKMLVLWRKGDVGWLPLPLPGNGFWRFAPPPPSRLHWLFCNFHTSLLVDSVLEQKWHSAVLLSACVYGMCVLGQFTTIFTTAIKNCSPLQCWSIWAVLRIWFQELTSRLVFIAIWAIYFSNCNRF